MVLTESQHARDQTVRPFQMQYSTEGEEGARVPRDVGCSGKIHDKKVKDKTSFCICYCFSRYTFRLLHFDFRVSTFVTLDLVFTLLPNYISFVSFLVHGTNETITNTKGVTYSRWILTYTLEMEYHSHSRHDSRTSHPAAGTRAHMSQ